jgi:hypothetical protein
MSIDDVLSRSRLREDRMWEPFSHCFLGAYDSGRRTILFGLYANSFENGFAYLVEISTEKLVQLVAEYDLNMAQLDAEQQRSVLEIASKRYLEVLDQLLHDKKMEVKQAQIDAESLEYDAKEAALVADQTALQTLQEKLAQAITKAAAEILILESRISEETIKGQYVDVEVLQKELAVTRTELKTLEAGVRGSEIQLKISETALQLTKLGTDKHAVQQKIDQVPGEKSELDAAVIDIDAKILHSGTGKGLLDSEIAMIELRTAKAKVDTSSKNVDTSLLDVDIAKANLDVAMVDVDIQKLEVKVAQEGAKAIQLETDTALVAVKVAELQLSADKVDVQLAEIEADIAMLDVRMLKEDLLALDQEIIEAKRDAIAYEIPLKKEAQIALIAKQVEVLGAKVAAAETYLTIENSAHASRQTKQTAEQAFRVAMAILGDEMSVHRAEARIESLSGDVTLAEESAEYKEMEDTEQIKVPDAQVSAARTRKNAAIDAAETMATADILNTLTHEIGAA